MTRNVMNIDQNKREAILKEAVIEFAKNGYLKGSTDTIAQKAGVSKGTLFNYFENKGNLYAETIIYTGNTFLETMDHDIFKNLTSIRELVQTSVKYKIATQVKYPHEMELLISSYHELDYVPEPIKEKIQKYLGSIWINSKDIYTGVLDNMDLREDVDRDTIRQYFELFLNGLMDMSSAYLESHPEVDTVEGTKVVIDQIDSYIDLFEQGILKR